MIACELVLALALGVREEENTPIIIPQKTIAEAL